MRFPLFATAGRIGVVALLLGGCAQPVPTGPRPQFAMERLDAPALAPAARETGRAAQARSSSETAAPAIPLLETALPAAGSIATPGHSAGGSRRPPAVAPRPDAYLSWADGRTTPVSQGDRIALPPGLEGIVTHFAPGSVPATLELAGGAVTLHPTRHEGRPEPTGVATLQGRLAGAELSVAYFSRGREAFCGTVAGADGTFTLSVPVDGLEDGVLVVREPGPSGKLGLARVQLQAGQAIEVPDVRLVSPDVAALTRLEAPEGLTALEGAVWAVEDSEGAPWRVPVWSQGESDRPVPGYALPDFKLVTGQLAVAPAHDRGSFTSGPADDLAAFLAPPDLSGLPASLGAGTPLAWPVIRGASLYTVRLYSATHSRPVWEAAVTRSAVEIPRDLVMPDAPLSLEVFAWDAPEVTVYSVASLRALRVPASPSGGRGRYSWALRSFGPPLKPAPPQAGPHPQALIRDESPAPIGTKTPASPVSSCAILAPFTAA